MALIDLLYRCPRCGYDPLPGAGEGAECPACLAVFTRAEGGGGIRVSFPDGAPAELPPYLLTQQIEAMGGALPDPLPATGEIRRATVRMQRSRREDPLRWGARLVGYVERFQEPLEGELRLSGETLEFCGPGGTSDERWELSSLAAVQGASSAVQVRGADGTLFQFRFPSDSPRRWESLLRIVVAEARRREGLGEVLEFQPRITSR